ncbi:MAG: hypothetical protein AAF639_10455 [Chloroflexota bacterium]
MSTSSFKSSTTSSVNTAKRNVKKVPFVEFTTHQNGNVLHYRLQGVVSSGSDIRRVYVSYFNAKTLDFHCSTNNNRPCGGLGSSPCKHLQSMLKEAVAQYGLDEVVQFLRVPGDLTSINSERDILARSGSPSRDAAGDVFSRFLGYLEHLEQPSSNAPVAGMAWFV